MVTASQIFDFLERHHTVQIERHEISSPEFGLLRRSLREIVFKLHDSDDEYDRGIADQIRVLLCEWLTLPVAFDVSLEENLTGLLGKPALVRDKWGGEVLQWYGAALKAAESLLVCESPVREALRDVLARLRSEGRDFRIACHRAGRRHFEPLFPGVADEARNFIHSARDYREAAPFDTLVKFGPLRGFGWGAVPDAIMTAPRFARLVQIVWSGCGDEEGFGYDPAKVFEQVGGRCGQRPGGIIWDRLVVRSGRSETEDVDFDEVDDLAAFSCLYRQGEKRRATLLQIDATQGILLAPNSEVLVLDPDPACAEPISRRTPDDLHLEGMFLVIPDFDDIHIDGLTAENGDYSAQWKKRLDEECRSDANGLVQRLRKAGLNLIWLRSAVEHWRAPPTTVIHAPQRIEHFRILLQELRLCAGPTDPWFGRAWREIARSRGEAIQFGVQQKDWVEERLIQVLRTDLDQILTKARQGSSFPMLFPSLQGACRFIKIGVVEPGFQVPESELRRIQELEAIERWRS